MSMKRLLAAQANPEKYKSTIKWTRASEIVPTVQANPEPFVHPDFKAVSKFLANLVSDTRTVLLHTGHKRKGKGATYDAAIAAAVKAYREQQ